MKTYPVVCVLTDHLVKIIVFWPVQTQAKEEKKINEPVNSKIIAV